MDVVPGDVVLADGLLGQSERGAGEIVFGGVERNEVFEKCGHSLALEADDRLANLLTECGSDRERPVHLTFARTVQ